MNIAEAFYPEIQGKTSIPDHIQNDKILNKIWNMIIINVNNDQIYQETLECLIEAIHDYKRRNFKLKESIQDLESEILSLSLESSKPPSQIGLVNQDMEIDSDSQSSVSKIELAETKQENDWYPKATYEPVREESWQKARIPYDEYTEKKGKYIPKGRPFHHEYHSPMNSANQGFILNLAAHDPQKWHSVLETWKKSVVNMTLKQSFSPDNAETMIRFMETFLGESAGAMWENFKSKFSSKYQNLVNLGKNPWNFVNMVALLVTSKGANIGMTVLQQQSIRKLDYRQLNDNTKEDAYIIPDKDMLIKKIQNAKWFSKLDLKSGFWQIKMIS